MEDVTQPFMHCPLRGDSGRSWHIMQPERSLICTPCSFKLLGTMLLHNNSTSPSRQGLNAGLVAELLVAYTASTSSIFQRSASRVSSTKRLFGRMLPAAQSQLDQSFVYKRSHPPLEK